MRTALITTTIRVPRVLELYRRLDPEVRIFVAGDQRTPHGETLEFLDGLGNAVYLSPSDQERLEYACSQVIGWNTLGRRNLALLEAIRWGADVVVTIDDDNIPLTASYFDDFRRVLGGCFCGVSVDSDRGWFDAGSLLEPPVGHRGFPYEHRHTDGGPRFAPVSDALVGVSAGLWLGDPDIDAIERLTNRPRVTSASALAHAGVLVAAGCYAPFNTQNTAIRGELAPLLMVLVDVGRHDDIWMSYIVQRVLEPTPFRLHFGRPFVLQQRNPHDLWQDVEQELPGMRVGARFAEDLRRCTIGGRDLLADLRVIHNHIRSLDYVPSRVPELGLAWCADVERARLMTTDAA